MQSTSGDWVASQRKTLLRWVNSKLPAPLKIADLAKDLRNGLLLAELVNQVSAVHNSTSTFVLVPVHKKPTFKLQMVENVLDILDYCRLILKINLTGISADSIVDGNEKLILGFVWLLFVNSSTTTISQLSTHGFVELKRIITTWVQNIITKKNISISNLNKDWSLSCNCRPDLILFEILEHYCPGKLSLGEKPVQNLSTIITFAETYLDIARLVDVDTFMDLIPDEKCILTYLVEWYMVMETKVAPQAQQIVDYDESLLLEPTLQFVILTIRLKNTYETKALRYINKVNSLVPKIASNLEYLRHCSSLSLTIESTLVNLRDGVHSTDYTKLLTDFSTTESLLNDFMSVTEGYEQYLNGTLSLLLIADFPELQSLSKHINENLKQCGLQYDPPKYYTPTFLDGKYKQLYGQGRELHLGMSASILAVKELMQPEILASSFLEIEKACSSKNVDDALKKQFISALAFVDHMTQVSVKLDTISKSILSNSKLFLTPEYPTDVLPVGNKYDRVNAQTYKTFREKLLQGNQLTEQELLMVLKNGAEEPMDGMLLKQLLRSIPSKSLEKHIDSDFQLSDGSDHDSDEGHSPNALFDGIQRKIDSKLFGFDKVYDTEEFLRKVETGFRI